MLRLHLAPMQSLQTRPEYSRLRWASGERLASAPLHSIAERASHMPGQQFQMYDTFFGL